MTLTEWFGIRRWHLSHVITEHNQFPRHIVRGHASLDADRRHIRKPCRNPAAGKLLAQDDCSLGI
jgi:hypothetical protein